jgi:hypothetical protein
MSIYPLHFSTNRALHCIRSVMKVVLGLTLVTLPINAYCTTLTEDDIKKIAAQSSVQMKGVDMGSGAIGRQTISVGRHIFYQYDVPDDWQIFPNARQAIISNSKKTGSAERWFNEKIDTSFVYFKKNSAPLMIDIRYREYSPFNFDLGEYISIKNHPKSKSINFKIQPPKDWLVEEGNGPNTVTKFTYKGNTFSVMTKEAPTFFSKSEARKEFSDLDGSFFDDILRECGRLSGRMISNSLVTIGSYPAVEAEYVCLQEIAGVKFELFTVSWMIFFEDKVVMLMGMGGNEVEFQELKKLYLLVAATGSFPERFN